MSSPLSRYVYPLAAATLVLTAGFSRTASARTCTTDSECGAGYQCSLGPSEGAASGEGGSTGSSTPGTPTSDPGVPVAVRIDGGPVVKTQFSDAGLPGPLPSTGTCEPKPIVCASAADCPVDFECEKDSIEVATPPCRSDGACATPPPQTSTTGTCRAVPRACSSAADCPAPLVCQPRPGSCSSGASVGPDGVVTTMPEICTPGKSVCTYVDTPCTADSGCADSYQCVGDAGSTTCTSSGGACRSIDGGPSCATPEPPACTTTTVKTCMPKQIACAAGQACPSGWSCFDYANLDGVPPGWVADESRKACLPDGLILAVQGHAADGSRGGSDSSGTVGGEKGSVSTPFRADGGLPGAVEVGGATDMPTVPVSKDQGCGCTLGGGASTPASPWLVLALAGLVVRLARRRR